MFDFLDRHVVKFIYLQNPKIVEVMQKSVISPIRAQTDNASAQTPSGADRKGRVRQVWSPFRSTGKVTLLPGPPKSQSFNFFAFNGRRHVGQGRQRLPPPQGYGVYIEARALEVRQEFAARDKARNGNSCCSHPGVQREQRWHVEILSTCIPIGRLAYPALSPRWAAPVDAKECADSCASVEISSH